MTKYNAFSTTSSLVKPESFSMYWLMVSSMMDFKADDNCPLQINSSK